MVAEVFLNEEVINDMNVENIEELLKKDISTVCKDLPLYKHISGIEIRKNEFEKTTTNKIKR